MKKCPTCNGKYDDYVKKCPACNEQLVEFYAIQTDSNNEQIEIHPTSLKGLRFCAKLYKSFTSFIIVVGLIATIFVLFALKNIPIGLVILAATLSSALLYYMVCMLFSALEDIVRALYHIANK